LQRNGWEETNVSEQEKKKVLKEQVLCEGKDGAPHVTLDRENRTIHHYVEGCPVAQARREAKRTGGPAMVSTEGFRRGWDAVDWGKKSGGLPS
jgi:hypothetical protein